MGAGGHIGAMVKSYRMNRNALASKRKDKPDLDYTYKKNKLKFKEPDKGDLDSIIHKIRRKKNRENILKKQFLMGSYILIGLICIIYLILG